MKRKRKETATWGVVRNREFIVKEGKPKLSFFCRFPGDV
jgi:hypothetical protein